MSEKQVHEAKMKQRRLDAKVAEHIFGNKFYSWEGKAWPIDLPHYSTDIAAAWDVAIVMQKEGFYVAVGPYWAEIGDHGTTDAPKSEALASHASMAICLAALKAKGVEYDGQ